MSKVFDGSTQWLNNNVAPFTAAPFTMACWFNPDTVATEMALMFVGDKDATNNYQNLAFRGDVAGDPIAAGSRNTAYVFAQSSAGAAGVGGVWYHACGVWASATSRVAYFNGANSGSETTSSSPDANDTYAIGRDNDSTPARFFDGKIAECAVWDVALTAAEVAILGLGYSPLFVRPQNLIRYSPLIRVSTDLVNVTLTENGSPTIDTHPRIIYPSASQMRRFATAGGTPAVQARANAILTTNPFFWGY